MSSTRNTHMRTAGLGVMTLASLALMSQPALAGIGGGGAGGGSGDGGGAGTLLAVYTLDDAERRDISMASPNSPIQNWGQNSKEYFRDWIDNDPVLNLSSMSFDGLLDTACDSALANAMAREPAATAARVVQVGISVRERAGAPGYEMAGTNPASFAARYNAMWPDEQTYLENYDQAERDGVRDEFLNQTNQIPSNVRVVCIALNDLEPLVEDVDYPLEVTTDVGTVFDQAGTTNPVNDIIHASTDDPDATTYNARSILHYDGPTGVSQQVSKDVQIAANGDTRSPDFTPSDFGWENWPAGNYWFDVQVSQQDGMTAAVDTPDRDPRESWGAPARPPIKVLTIPGTDTTLPTDAVLVSGQAYEARVSGFGNGYTDMRLLDVINTDQVWIGTDSADDASTVRVVDSAGQNVSATVNIDRSNDGQVVVSADISDIELDGQYTMIVPTYVLPTNTDYDIPDESQGCYGASFGTCLDGNSAGTRKVTPPTDKVWTINEEGALVVSDSGHTNNVGADNQVFVPGSPVSAVVNGHIPTSLTQPLDSYVLTDDWTDAAEYVDFSDPSMVKVFLNGNDVTSQFDISVDGTVTTATATEEFLAETADPTGSGMVKLVLNGRFLSDYDTAGELEELTNSGSQNINNEGQDTNTPSVFTVTPLPDKAWVLDEDGALVTNDPDWTNLVGADTKVFLPNDAVSAVVNGDIPANLAIDLTHYSITDDWTDASEYVDFSDASMTKVFFNGNDVTEQFDISVDGTVTTATATEEFLAETANRPTDGVVKLVLSGNFRDDYDTEGELVRMINAGSETWNETTHPTNEPPVFTWTPDPEKDVIASGQQGGDQSSIDGLSVWPGQIIEYQVNLDVRIPDNLAYGDFAIESFAVEDQFDVNFMPDKPSLEFYDARTNKVIPRTDWSVEWNDNTHSFVATFTEEWVTENLASSAEDGWLIMRLDGKVSNDAPDGVVLTNQAFEIINGAKTTTNIPEVTIPSVNPDKEDLNTDLQNIDGKTVVQGDKIVYRLTMDAGPDRDELAYNVHKLGMVDDYDEEYLDINAEGIQVLDKETGVDVTDQFNIQVVDGKFYVFAKTVDTTTINGELVPGDPQPENLAEYNEASIDPVNDAIVDQDLLGRDFWIVATSTVTQETDGYVIENQAWQNLENTVRATRIVSNPLKDIDPVKDVVISEAEQDSINGETVDLNSVFNYKLTTSEIPADRAYDASQWSIVDTFDAAHDRFTGQWAVYTDQDIYDGDTLVFSAGDLLADSAGHESETYAGMFETVWDAETATLSVQATDAYFDLINTRSDLVQGWSVYTQMERIAPAEQVLNTHTERYNEIDRPSNEVVTNTPENPAIDVEKFTLSEGLEAGDRDVAEQAYPLDNSIQEDLGNDAEDYVGEPAPEPVDEAMADDDSVTDDAEPVEGEDSEVDDEVTVANWTAEDAIKVGFQVTNTGDVPLKDVTLTDEILNGSGEMIDITCEVPMDDDTAAALSAGSDMEVPDIKLVAGTDIEILSVGQVIDCTGILQGVKPGELHGNKATATGVSIFTDTVVSDDDPWFAQAPEHPMIDIEKYTVSEGVVDGDRDSKDDPYTIALDEMETEIGFVITNTGDVTLENVVMTDATITGNGMVDNITCEAPVLPVSEDDEDADMADESGDAEAEAEEPTIVETDADAADEADDVSQADEADDDVAFSDDPAEIGSLEPGEAVTCVGDLVDVEAGSDHQNTATVTGESASGTQVTDADDWFAVKDAPAPDDTPTPIVTPEPDPDKSEPKGAQTGGEMEDINQGMIVGGIAALLAAMGLGTNEIVRRRRNKQQS